MVLWHLIHDQCLPHAKAGQGSAPCLSVDLREGEARGTVVLKDRRGVAQMLVMPTARVPGIESPELLRADAPNYFAAAWDARAAVSARLPRALQPDEISLAINAASARSQDQFHIHVDCLRPDVRDTLRQLRNGGGDIPARIQLAGAVYDLFSLPIQDLPHTNPFVFVKDHVANAKGNMGQMTLVLVGGPDSMWLLAAKATMFDPTSGHGEDLQDHTCAIANP